jgi:thioredoxin-dependent peroxiredoxin
MDVKLITRAELKEMFDSGKKFKLVDVLDTDHYSKEHIKDAISIPLDVLREQAPLLLNKDEPVIVYCASFDCHASTTAAKILMALGYNNVLDYKGGIQDWKEGKLPLASGGGNIEAQKKQVAMQGKPMTLIGRKIKAGMVAPYFRAVNNKLKEVTLDDFKGKIKVITSFISIDTPVCDLQVKEFNKRVTNLSSNLVVIGISKDLPFAQEKFCALNNITNVTTLSDYKYSSFSINYGLLLKELNLTARAVVVLDANDVIRYIQIVDELTTPPDYDQALAAIKEVINTPPIAAAGRMPAKCVPCEAGTPPLPAAEIQNRFAQLKGWELVEGKKLVKEFKFKDFVEAKYFLDLAATIAEEQGHHPNFTLIYNKLKITTTTHVAGGLTPNDFMMANFIDEIAGEK